MSIDAIALARLVMAGHTHAEIAGALGCGEKSVALKVKLIRRIWRERAGIKELIYKMHGAPGDFNSLLQGLALRVKTGERRQQ